MKSFFFVPALLLLAACQSSSTTSTTEAATPEVPAAKATKPAPAAAESANAEYIDPNTITVNGKAPRPGALRRSLSLPRPASRRTSATAAT
ncbi:hypothetical protein LGH70_15435 [Hymenobacter sp. BT635]|uniref:Uncharacterized protein n=1 Tax=Hymenobacter nitidus TaxID=2880929 RepID=A0ABS8AEZ8_9BACT|nr:hypothetical protein [Hymenobacter nitidus]